MRTLIVGAGATGGYLGAKLIAGGRDVTFLAHQTSAQQLVESGLRIRWTTGEVSAIPVRAVTRDRLVGTYDVVILAVRAGAAATAVQDAAAAVGPRSVLVSVVNGMDHLDMLTASFGPAHVLGGAAQLATSLRDGVIVEVMPGIDLHIGVLSPEVALPIDDVASELTVDGMTTTAVDDIIANMWQKFAFITSGATLTCLLRDVIGEIARTPGGEAVAGQVIAEVEAVARTDGYPLTQQALAQLRATLTDKTSSFAPSMFRDLISGRPVESEILADFARRARRYSVETPLLDAALVAIELHNRDDAGAR